MWPGFALPLLTVSLLGQHTQSVVLKESSAFDYLLLYGQKRVLGAAIYPRTEQNQEPPCDLKYAVFLCPLSSGESPTLMFLLTALCVRAGAISEMLEPSNTCESSPCREAQPRTLAKSCYVNRGTCLPRSSSLCPAPPVPSQNPTLRLQSLGKDLAAPRDLTIGNVQAEGWDGVASRR